MKRERIKISMHGLALALLLGTCAPAWGQGLTQAAHLTFTLPSQVTEEVVVPFGALLVVDAGNAQYLIKPESTAAEQISIRATKAAFKYSASSRIYTLSRQSVAPTTLALRQATTIGGNGGIQLTFNGVMEMRTRPDPVGPCKGVCCTATCFSVTCCSDAYECNGGKCDCKPKQQCPPPTGGTTTAFGGENDPFPPVFSFVELFNGASTQLKVRQ